MLQEIRIRRGLSRERLAKLAGVCSRTIYLAERQGRQPHNSTIEVLARALKVSPGDLFPNTNERNITL